MDTTYKNPNANFFPQPSSTTISNEALANPAPLTLPNAPQDTTNYAGITTSIPTFQDIQSQINQTSQAETTADDLMQRILGTSAQVGQKAQRTFQAEQQAGLPQFQTQLQDVNSQLQALQKEALAIPLQLQEQATGRGVTAGGLAPIQTGQLRQNAIKSLTLSAIGQTLQGNIANAQATAQRAVDLEFAPLEAELNTLKTAYEMNKDRLNRQDKKRADALNLQIAERTRLLELAKSNATTGSALALAAMKNFPNDPTAQYNAQQAMAEAQKQNPDLNKIFSLVGQYQNDPIATKKALLENEKLEKEIKKINKEANAQGVVGIANKDAGKYATALSVILGSEKFTKDQKNAIINSVNNGEAPFTVIKNQAKNLMGQTLATELDKAESAKSQIVEISNLLDEFYANGGKTDVFSGNFEKAINNLGQVKDPKLVEIATRLGLAMQEYRLAVTGTAASVQEDARIDKVFPGITSSEGLNNARTKALIDSFDNKIDTKYRNTLGPTYDTLKQLEIGQTQEPSQQKTSKVYRVGNVDYVEGPDGKYYPQNTQTQQPAITSTSTNTNPTQKEFTSMLPDMSGYQGFSLNSIFK